MLLAPPLVAGLIFFCETNSSRKPKCESSPMKLPAFTLIAMFALIGCGSKKWKNPAPAPLPTSAPAPFVQVREGEINVPASPVLPVKQGPPPLAYIVEHGGMVRVVEVESGSIIAAGECDTQAIVSVDAQTGVRIGNNLMLKGPLPEGRTYQIFLETGNENTFRSESRQPVKQRRTR